MIEDDASPWYAVITAPGREREAQAGLERYGVRSYLPTRMVERKPRRASTKRYLATLPLFPRYVLIQVGTEAGFFPLRLVPAVTGLICADRRPLQIPPSVIDRIRHEQEMGLHDRLFVRASDFEKGSSVKIKAGALEGWLATVRGARSETTLSVLVHLLGRDVVAKVAVADVVKIA